MSLLFEPHLSVPVTEWKIIICHDQDNQLLLLERGVDMRGRPSRLVVQRATTGYITHRSMITCWASF